MKSVKTKPWVNSRQTLPLTWVQSIDQTQIETALNDYQQQIEDYINNQNPDATVGDVLGTQKVILQAHQQLATGLPYDLLVRTHNYPSLPDELRHKFRYTLGTELYGIENSRLITFEQSLPEIAGQKLALSFKPATQADEDLIASYLPEPDPETGEIDPAQLPDTLPGYLIGLTAEFTQEGTVIHSAEAGNMGGELYETLGLWSPAFGWDQAVNHPIAGEYRAIGLDLQGLNKMEAARLRTRMAETREIVGIDDLSRLGLLTKRELFGDLMYATIYNYFASNNEQDEVESSNINIVSYRLPSYGVYSTVIQTDYWFGLARNVTFSGMVIDVDRLAIQTVAKSNNLDHRRTYVESVGMRASALEHAVLEEIWGSDENEREGVSAVKAIQLAMQEGQRIWIVESGNVDFVLTQINVSSEIQSEIENAVSTGKNVTVHESPVVYSASGAQIFGYIIKDPNTGAGAYKISGGLSGGAIDSPSSGLLPYFPIEALHHLVETFGAPLQKLYDCIVESLEGLMAFIVLVIITALLLRLGPGIIGGALVFGLIAGYASGAAAGVRPDDCGLTCDDHFTNCLDSSIQSQSGPVYGSSACFTCRNVCESNDGFWPEIARSIGNATRCDYWNF